MEPKIALFQKSRSEYPKGGEYIFKVVGVGESQDHLEAHTRKSNPRACTV